MKNSVFLSRPSRARHAFQSSVRVTYIIAILLTLASLAMPMSSLADDSAMGVLQGNVSVVGADGQSHNVPGAKVRLSGTSQNASMFAGTDYAGDYKFGSVTPGRYTLEVALDGFENVARLITIHASEKTIENIKLEVKSVREYVAIRAERVGMNISETRPISEITQNIERRLGNAGFNVQARKFIPRCCNYDPSVSKTFAPRVALDSPVTSRSYRFRFSPKVFNVTNLFKPRALPGDLTAEKFGTHPKSVGRMFGIRLVIEKK